MTNTERLNAFASVAVPICRELKHPPELLLAQWAAESAWGTKEAGTNNVFGMTKAARHKKWEWVPTREILTGLAIGRLDPDEQARITSKVMQPNGRYEVRLSRRFAAFDSVEAAVRDQIKLIQTGSPYKKAWARYQATGGLSTLIQEVAAIYATDPSYGALLLAISNQKNINDAVKANESHQVS